MHSVVYVVGSKLGTDEIDDVLDEVPGADYIGESQSFDDDIQWLEETYGLKEIKREDGCVTLKMEESATQKWLEKYLEKVHEALSNLENKFSWTNLFLLEQAANDKHGFCFYYGEEIYTATEFFGRAVDEKGLTFAVCQTLDYHF